MIKFTFGAAAYLVSTLLATLLRGFVLVQLWTWFVVPFGMPNIGYAHALGISTVVAFLTYELYSPSEEDVVQTMVVAFFKSVFFSLLAWGFGALYHSFM